MRPANLPGEQSLEGNINYYSLVIHSKLLNLPHNIDLSIARQVGATPTEDRLMTGRDAECHFATSLSHHSYNHFRAAPVNA